MIARILIHSISALVVLQATISLAAQPSTTTHPDGIEDLDWNALDQGNLHCNITNFGLVGATPGSGAPYQTAPSAEWPAFSGVEYLWSSGIWIGAMINGKRAVSTASYSLEFRPGREAFDALYEAKEGDVGGNRLPSASADDDGDGKIDEDPLDGYDNDNDLKVDEDFAAISDQMFTSRFNDYDPDIELFHPEHQPLGVEVFQTTMVWFPQLNENIIGFDYKIVNAGLDTLMNAYVGFFADFDIGRFARGSVSTDDRSGFWEGTVQPNGGGANVPVSIGYMLDNDGDVGEAEGAIGIVFLNAEGPSTTPTGPVKLRNYRSFSGNVPYGLGGDPTIDSERYAVLNGTAPFSLAAPDANTNRSAFSTPAGDYRNLVSIGPFETLIPGDTVCVSMAMVIGLGFDGMLQTAAQAQILYDGLWFDCDNDPQTGVDGKECNVHWLSDVPTPVDLQQFSANLLGKDVQLSWQLSPETLRDLSSVSLQRSSLQEGPYSDRETPLTPTLTMSFLDKATQTGNTYWYRLLLTRTNGAQELTRAVSIQVQGQPFTRPELFVSVPSTAAPVELRYRVAPNSGPLALAIYDVRGQLVRNIDNTRHEAGEYWRTWDRRDQNGAAVSQGVYLVNLRTAGESLSRKVVLVQ